MEFTIAFFTDSPLGIPMSVKFEHEKLVARKGNHVQCQGTITIDDGEAKSGKITLDLDDYANVTAVTMRRSDGKYNLEVDSRCAQEWREYCAYIEHDLIYKDRVKTAFEEPHRFKPSDSRWLYFTYRCQDKLYETFRFTWESAELTDRGVLIKGTLDKSTEPHYILYDNDLPEFYHVAFSKNGKMRKIKSLNFVANKLYYSAFASMIKMLKK